MLCWMRTWCIIYIIYSTYHRNYSCPCSCLFPFSFSPCWSPTFGATMSFDWSFPSWLSVLNKEEPVRRCVLRITRVYQNTSLKNVLLFHSYVCFKPNTSRLPAFKDLIKDPWPVRVFKGAHWNTGLKFTEKWGVPFLYLCVIVHV